MQYLLLIYKNEAEFGALSDAEKTEIFQQYQTFTEEIAKKGYLKATNAVDASSTSTVVKVKGGKIVTTDGPFVESREQIGGYYLIEAKDLDEAIAIAAKIPHARTGAIEIRPVML